MSRKGGTFDAQLGGVHGDTVTLLGKDAKEIKLKLADLSLADRQHLVEVGGANAAIITSGKHGLVEKEVRIDTTAFKRLDGKLTFPDGPSMGFELLETPHFLIGKAGKIRPNAVAETAERLWHGMAFEHMNFRQDWGAKRQLILLVASRDMYAGLGKWYANFLGVAGDQDGSRAITNTWSRIGSTTMALPEKMISEYKLNERALVFNVKDEAPFRKDLAPFPTHTIAGQLLGKQLGGVTSFGSEGYFAITTGHAYFKEIHLAGKTETNLLTVTGSMKDDISSKRGFEDGTSWAKTLRPLVRSGKVTVKLAPMLEWKPEDLNPERLVLIYSFAYYMESDSKRLAAFANMVRRIETSKQIPTPEEIAKIFGFDTVDALEKNWANFIKEGDFK